MSYFYNEGHSGIRPAHKTRLLYKQASLLAETKMIQDQDSMAAARLLQCRLFLLLYRRKNRTEKVSVVKISGDQSRERKQISVSVLVSVLHEPDKNRLIVQHQEQL